ncbi:unnamed protein product, partial [Trichogramma brassicae]
MPHDDQMLLKQWSSPNKAQDIVVDDKHKIPAIVLLVGSARRRSHVQIQMWSRLVIASAVNLVHHTRRQSRVRQSKHVGNLKTPGTFERPPHTSNASTTTTRTGTVAASPPDSNARTKPRGETNSGRLPISFRLSPRSRAAGATKTDEGVERSFRLGPTLVGHRLAPAVHTRGPTGRPTPQVRRRKLAAPSKGGELGDALNLRRNALTILPPQDQNPTLATPGTKASPTSSAAKTRDRSGHGPRRRTPASTFKRTTSTSILKPKRQLPTTGATCVASAEAFALRLQELAP